MARHTERDEEPRVRSAGRTHQGGRRRAHAPWTRLTKAPQRTLGDFFPTIDSPTRTKAVQRGFREEKRRQLALSKLEEGRVASQTRRELPGLHQADQTFSCLTQNVNGFGATEAHRDEWLRALRKSDEPGRLDIVLLQETHVEATDIEFMTGLHARTWGFPVGPGCPVLSFWSPSMERRGGVAILVDPYGRLKGAKPALERYWSPHFMAVSGTQDGMEVLYVCIYAPHQPGPREKFYWQLVELDLPARERMVVGGDFNCTMDPRLDRSHYRRYSAHESAGLAALQAQWGLDDAVPPPTERDDRSLADFFTRTHTYRYALPTGEPASARLDRWYTTPGMSDWVSAVDVAHPGARADHQAVRLHLTNPHDPIRLRRPARVYPSPAIAIEHVHEAVGLLLDAFLDRIQDAAADAMQLAQQWVDIKTDIRVTALRIIKQRRKTARATYKQKHRRLIRQEQRILAGMAGQPASVEMIKDMMEALSLQDGKGATPLQRLRATITDCVRGRLALRQRRLFHQQGYRRGSTSKQFFRRLSTTFGDTTVHRLDAATGHPERGVHAKPDIIADAWTGIFQQEPCSEDARQAVLCWLGEPGQYTALLADLMDPLTEAEVTGAITVCKPGKACGPDRLGNDFYRDFAAKLAPILTILYNAWYQAGLMPTTFLEADIFCLKKGGGPTDPLNFGRCLSWILTTGSSPGFLPHG